MNQDRDTIMKFQENPTLRNKYMRAAFKEAEKAFDKDEVPVGAVVVFEGKIIAKDHNRRETKQAFHAHAEFLAMQKAAKKIGSWRLEACDIYVTMEPCPMCAGAMIQSRVRSIHYATKDPKSGAHTSILDLFNHPFNHHVIVTNGTMEKECRELIQSFFRKLRDKK